MKEVIVRMGRDALATTFGLCAFVFVWGAQYIYLNDRSWGLLGDVFLFVLFLWSGLIAILIAIVCACFAISRGLRIFKEEGLQLLLTVGVVCLTLSLVSFLLLNVFYPRS